MPSSRASDDVVHHRSTDERDLAPALHAPRGDLLHAMQVRREPGDDEALRSGWSRRMSRITGPTVASDAREARALGVRRVGQEQPHALAADLAEAGEVGAAAVDRREVDLEVAGVQDRAGGRAVRDRERVRHRVRHRHELAVERADAPCARRR